MTIDKNTPCVKCSDRLLTIAEAEKALEHAAAFLMLAQSVDPHRFSMAAGEWFRSYGISGDFLKNDTKKTALQTPCMAQKESLTLSDTLIEKGMK